MKNIVIVLPTYNEALNIENFLYCLIAEFTEIESQGFNMQILVVDDFSPDGTSNIVKEHSSFGDKICLIQKTKEGLGAAYIAGFKYAIESLNADYVMEMDSDFSHNPKDVKRFVEQIACGYDLVIGSRYVEGGSIPENWAIYRKLNSKYGNVFANHIIGLKQIKDCTSGFRLINANLLKQVDFGKHYPNGYAFQVKLLFDLFNLGAKIVEIPINFVDRKFGKSKLSIKDILEFIKFSFLLKYKV